MSIQLNEDIFEDYIVKYPLEKDAKNLRSAETRVYGYLFYCGQCDKEFYFAYPYRIGAYSFELTERQKEEQRAANNIKEMCQKEVKHIMASGHCPMCNKLESFGRKGYSLEFNNAEPLFVFKEYSNEQQDRCIKEIYETMREDRGKRHEKDTIVNVAEGKEYRLALYMVAGIVAVFLIAGLILFGVGQYKIVKRDQIIERWKIDGCVDYTDINEFENAVNNGDELEGKIVTFTVKEIYPNSLIGYDLRAGEDLNFVSDNDPGVEVGEEITVLVTGVKKIITIGYKISFIILEK